MTTPDVLRFDSSTVQLEVLEQAVYALNAVMTVEIRHEGDDYVCHLHPRDDTANMTALAHRMRAEVIDQSLRRRLAQETAPLRDLIFALAFANTGLAEADDGEKSDGSSSR